MEIEKGCSLPNAIWDGAPAEIRFGSFFTLNLAAGESYNFLLGPQSCTSALYIESRTTSKSGTTFAAFA